MQSLNTIQQDFFDDLNNDSCSAMLAHIKLNDIDAQWRFNVYKMTVKENLRNALALTFPSVWKLLGPTCADKVAFAFIATAQNLPKSGCLDDWGANFSVFLNKFPPLEQLFYLSDIAQIDWLKHLSYCAQDSDDYDLKLFKMGENEIATLKFDFHPNVFLYKSTFQVRNIMELLENPDQEESIQVSNNIDYIIIKRQENEITLHWINESLFAFLSALNTLCLLEAYEKVKEIYRDFDLNEGLKELFAMQLITTLK